MDDDGGQTKPVYTSEQEEQFRWMFSLRREKQYIGTAVFGALVVFTLAISALIGGYMAFTMSNWRCPACDGDLWTGRMRLPTHSCRWCGIDLG